MLANVSGLSWWLSRMNKTSKIDFTLKRLRRVEGPTLKEFCHLYKFHYTHPSPQFKSTLIEIRSTHKTKMTFFLITEYLKEP
jgi:hypothetical protein